MSKKDKKNITRIVDLIDSEEKELEQSNDQNVYELKIDSKAKLNSQNIFDFLDKVQGYRNIIIPKKMKRILQKLNNKKRKKPHGFEEIKNDETNIAEIKNVSKYYLTGNIATKVLSNVSLEIKKGELLLIYGASGSGKSTLLNIISGLDRPSKGDVVVCDKNLIYMSDSEITLFRRENISFIFQNYNLLENLNSFDNVKTGSYLQKKPERQIDILELFKKFKMEEEIAKFPPQMSGGQQQRVSIMRALAKNADLIFADEPTGALDEQTSEIVLRILFNINKETKSTVVMVSHDPYITSMADRIIYVADGKIDKIVVNEKPKLPF